MRVTFDPAKRQRTLLDRGIDMNRAREVFNGVHMTRIDDRRDYGEPRFVTVGWLDARLVVLVWTPKRRSKRIISMRHCHEREAKRIRTQLEGPG